MKWWMLAEWVLLAPALWCTLAQWLGYDGDRVTASLLALYPFIMLAGLGGGIVAILHDHRPGFLAALAVTCTFGGISNTTPSRQPKREPGVDKDNVRLVVANLLASNPQPSAAAEAVTKAVTESAAQVLVLVEPTARMVSEIELRGGGMQHSLEVVADDPSGLSLRTSVPIRGQVLTVEAQAWVDAVAQFGERPVRLIAAHPYPPTMGATAWRRQLGWLAREVGNDDSAVVVAGDFNACRWHPSFRRLLRATGLRSAHEVVGRVWSCSWPANRLRPFVRLDHALVRGVHAYAARDFKIPGSDHRGFVVTLDAGATSAR
ncbi:MAG TPA: hypothetical protein PLV13_04120 [Ilumatobacteraceae bacterium]|nr:hypothetical protein [Ilumatobacteraceae bacterium]